MHTSIRRVSDCVVELVARGPISHAAPMEVVEGWAVSARRSSGALRLVDCTPLSKVMVRADEGGPTARGLQVRFGQAVRDLDVLIIGSGPGEWTLIGPLGQAQAISDRAIIDEDTGLVTVMDLSHARALMRLIGADSPQVLSKVCGINFSDDVTPNGAAFRSEVAKIVTDVTRDDLPDERSYLLHCERSFGQYLFDSLLDAGAEFGIEVDGFRPRDFFQNSVR